MDSEGHLLWLGRNVLDLRARLVRGIGLDGVYLEIVGEQLDRSGIGGAQLVVELKPLARTLCRAAYSKGVSILVERCGDAQCVGGQKAGDVEDEAAVRQRGTNITHPHYRRCKILAPSITRTSGPEAWILELNRDLLSHSAKSHDLGLAGATAVEKGWRGAQAGAKRCCVKVARRNAIGACGRQCDQDMASIPVPWTGSRPILRDAACEWRRRLGRGRHDYVRIAQCKDRQEQNTGIA